jgi:type IVB pilus formation R64 PilN family outer membrane protein
MRTRSVAAGLCLLLGMLSGCSNLLQKVSDRISGSESRSDALVKETGRVEAVSKAATAIVYENGVFIAKSQVRLPAVDTLPPAFYEAATFDRTVHSLSEFAERITVRAGIAVKVAPDAQAASVRALTGTGGAPAATPGVQSAGASGFSAGAPNAGGTDVRIVYPSGTLKGLLDTAASRFGVYWKYVDGTINFYYVDTRTFQITAIPGDSALSATVSSGSSTGDASGAAGTSNAGPTVNTSQNTAVKSQLSVFGSLEKAITAMLTPYGKVVASPPTGTITVTDTPESLDRVSLYIESENKTLARQVMISVTVLSVAVSDGDSMGLNWNLVYGDLFRKYGIRNTYTSDPGAASFSASILNTNSKFGGTSLIIDALATQGRVRKETTASVATLNNQPVPVQVAKQTSYLKSSETSITANVGSTTSLTPGTVTSGFNMTVLPHVLNNGTVMLQFSTDMSNLRRIRTVSSDKSTIETPELDTRNFMQRVAMKSGETLIISGFEQVDDSGERQGVGHPTNFLFGGGIKSASAREVIVILVTPIMMNGA